MSIFKLTHLSSLELSLETLMLLREKLPLPFEIHIKAKKTFSNQNSKLFLQKKIKEKIKQDTHKQVFTRYSEAQKAIEENTAFSEKIFFNFELHIIITRDDKQALKRRYTRGQEGFVFLLEIFLWKISGPFLLFALYSQGRLFIVPLLEKQWTGLPSLLASSVQRTSYALLKKISKTFFITESIKVLMRLIFLTITTIIIVAFVIGKSGKGKSVFSNILFAKVSLKTLYQKCFLLTLTAPINVLSKNLRVKTF